MPGTQSAGDAASAKLLRRVLWAFVVVFGSIFLFVALLYGHNKSHEYQAATPTTATITSCFKGRGGDVSCSGTWNVGGHQYRGLIEGADSVLSPGLSVSVRANSYRAYTMTSTSSFYNFAIGVSVFLAIAAVVLLVWGGLR